MKLPKFNIPKFKILKSKSTKSKSTKSKSLKFDITKMDAKYFVIIPAVLFILFTLFSGNPPTKSAKGEPNSPVTTSSAKVTVGPVQIVDPTGEPSKNNQNKIVVAAWKDEATEITEAVEYFKKKFPENNVEFRLFNLSTYMDQLANALELREDIDVFLVRNVNDYALAFEKKFSTDIDQLVRREDIDTSKFGRSFKDLRMNNKIHGLPYKRNIYMLYYNKNIFERLKIPFPEKTMTWSDYRSLAKRISDKEKNPKVWGAFMDSSPQSWYIQALQRGAILSESNNVNFENALQFRLSMEKDGSISTYKNQKIWKMHYNTEFPKGNTAMHITGDWHIKQLLSSSVNFSWDVAPVPYPDSGESNISIGNYSIACISSNSKKVDKALAFIKFLAGSDAGKKLEKSLVLPASLDVEMINAFEEQLPGKPKNIKAALKQDFVLEYPADAKGYNLANSVYFEEGEAVFEGTSPIKSFGQKVTDRAKILQNSGH